METNEKLNEVAETLGEINYIPTVTEEKYKDDYINALDKAYDSNSTSYAYGDAGPMPGQPVVLNTAPALDTENEKKIANQRLIAQAAQMKLRKEKEEFNKKSDSEKIRIYVCDALLKQQEQEYFNAHHYYMSGPIRKKTRKIIENNYRKGKYKITQKMKDDILYELSLSSNQADPNKNNPAKKPATNVQMRNLVSSI